MSTDVEHEGGRYVPFRLPPWPAEQPWPRAGVLGKQAAMPSPRKGGGKRREAEVRADVHLSESTRD